LLLRKKKDVSFEGYGFTLFFQALRLGQNDTGQKLSDTTKAFSLKGRLAGIVVT
jgi:hypothetical protein